MTRGSKKPRIRSEIAVKVHSDNEEDVGTAARTRPFSYDEIMLRRKNRKVTEYSNDGEIEVEKLSSEVATRYDSSQSAHNGENIKTSDARASYRKKEEKDSKKGTENAKSKKKDFHELDPKLGQKMEKHIHPKSIEKIGKDVHHKPNEKMEKVERIENDKHQRSGEKLDKDVHQRSGEKLDKDVHPRSSEKLDKDVLHRSGEKLDKDVHHRSSEKLDKDVHHRSSEKLDKDVHHKSSEKLSKDVHHRFCEKLEKNRYHKSTAKVEKDAHQQSNQKRENDTSYRDHRRTDRDTSRRLKQNSEKENDKSSAVDREHDRTTMHERLRKNSEYDNEKRRHKDNLASKTKDIDRDTTIERAYKRKDRSGDDVQHEHKQVVRKHDSEHRLVKEVSERKERIDSSNSRHEETRLKRRRSKSPEHRKERGRRSGSFSPKARKYSSSRGDELHLDKDKPKPKNDTDRSKTSNGSGGLYQRHGGSSSGLGGYSPRKRKTDAAVRTPSPLKRSPENRSAGWERNVPGSISTPKSSAPSAPQILVQAKPSILVEPAGVVLANLNASNSLPSFPPSIKNAAIDSVQLTQATRPLRRLYVDNVPSSASEKDIMECFNDFLLSSGANRIQGTKSCISCMIHKEKGQALVEFLTPEDASAALAFDSRSFFGSFLNIRRPKDFVEMANDFPERLKAGVDAVSGVVKDSPHKIFVGGISDTLTSEMLLEILRAFGPLKAFRFEINENVKEHCAFLEFVDQSVTLKACAALNGMKLGGRVLTVAQAFPNASFVETCGDEPSYEIPQHVKTLLEKPTEVLKIKNVFDPSTIKLLPESELEEILEDVREECTRFGAVKSINIVSTVDTVIPETQETTETSIVKSELDADPLVDDDRATLDSIKESERKPEEEQELDAESRNSDSTTVPIKTEDPMSLVPDDDDENRVAPDDSILSCVPGSEVDSEKPSETDEKMDRDDVFEPGCVFVEFRREEASCVAAHRLHGRLFDGRAVTVEYVPHHVYKKRFSKSE